MNVFHSLSSSLVKPMLLLPIASCVLAQITHDSLSDHLFNNITNININNRYRDIAPYDTTRVKLSGSPDYINASHVRFGSPSKPLNTVRCLVSSVFLS